MSELVFVVVASGGEYDSAWEQNLYAYRSRADAGCEVERLEAFQARVRPLVNDIKQAAYAVLGNRPVMLQTPAPPPVPKKANREEYARYQRAHAAWKTEIKPIVDENNARLEANYQLARQAAVNTAIDLGCSDEDIEALGLYDPVKWLGGVTDTTEISYNIEELELR